MAVSILAALTIEEIADARLDDEGVEVDPLLV